MIKRKDRDDCDLVAYVHDASKHVIRCVRYIAL